EDPGDLPLHVTSIRGRPPFTPAEEQALMQAHGITHLLTKNSGGDGAKLDAADRLGVTVLMIRRPAPPPGPHAATTDAALAWVEALAAHGRQKNQPG
ncbi:MAG: precorrin-6A/cobalt-precorrin-6A reductase, partial [Pseudomonadota bacterium]